MRVKVRKLKRANRRLHHRASLNMPIFARGIMDIGLFEKPEVLSFWFGWEEKAMGLVERIRQIGLMGQIRRIGQMGLIGHIRQIGQISLSLKRFAAAALVLGLILQGGGFKILETSAYFNDAETSANNTFSAGALDFSLSSPSDFSPATLNKGETSSRTVNVSNDGTLDFQYKVSAEEVSGDSDLCDAFILEAMLATTTVYSGLLKDFVSATTTFDVLTSDWQFAVGLPSTAIDSLQDKTCTFKFIYSGWQADLQDASYGFLDIEEIQSTLNSGHWTIPTEPVDDNISPIADSYVNQASGVDDNYGNDNELKINSESGGKNKRAFVRFDFYLPSGITISTSTLKLYMKDAPGVSRNYEARSVLATWNERDPSGIIWNNQPSASSTPTDTVTSGTSNNQWKSWNVKPDVRAIVDGADNYGWMLKDSSESSATSYEAKFYSREDNNESLNPVLEVAFSAPPASTDHVVINEVYYDVGSGKGNDPNNEWVEIYNPTNSAIDISGWKICEKDGCDIIPSTIPIPAKGFAIASGKSTTWEDFWVLPVGVITIDLPGDRIGDNGLHNDGDRVELRDNGAGTGALVDAMSYGDDATYLVLSDALEGDSLARVIKGYDSNAATDWIINATSNPGTNPSGENGGEIMRFTNQGVEVASIEEGLIPLSGEGTVLSEQSILMSEGLVTNVPAEPEILTSELTLVTGQSASVSEAVSGGILTSSENAVEEVLQSQESLPESFVLETKSEEPNESNQQEGGGDLKEEPALLPNSEQTPMVEPPAPEALPAPEDPEQITEPLPQEEVISPLPESLEPLPAIEPPVPAE